MADVDTMPHAMEVEAALLGCLLFDNTSLALFDFLRPEDFYDPFHGRVFEVATDLIAKNRLADGLTVKAQLDGEAEGGFDLGANIASLHESAVPAPMAADYARIVQDMALRRDLIRIAEEMKARAGDANSEGGAKACISEAEAMLFEASRLREGAAGAVSIGRAARDALRSAETIKAGQRPEGIVYTGLRTLDRALGGLEPEELIILAGRPGMGKSATLLRVAMGAARFGSVLDFTLEMSATQNAVRALAAYADGPNYSDIAAGRYEDAGQLHDAAERVARLPVYFEETPGLTPPQILTRARRFARRMADTPNPLRLVVVDHMGRVAGSRSGMKPYERVSEAVEALKNIAKELGIPVVAGCQLSRELKNRSNKRPMLDDLRESGRIEEEADIVVGLYRDAYYAELEPAPDGEDAQAEWSGRLVDKTLEALILKNRQGPTTTVKLWADMGRNLICDLRDNEEAA